MDNLSPDDPMLEMRQTLHDTSLENTSLRQRVEALERELNQHHLKERAEYLLNNPPLPEAGLSKWQAWKEETDMALAAAQDNAHLAEAP